MLGIRMGNDVTVVVDDEYGASANAGVLEALQNGVERDHRREHAREVVLGVLQRHCHDEGGAIIRRQCQRIAAEFNRLDAAYEGALQGLGNEGILLRAKISLRCSGTLPVAATGGPMNARV